jgi:conjugal transfer pilus assembly protein TraK
VKTCAWWIASLLLPASAAMAQETSVAAEQTTAVIVSNRDVNRLYCVGTVEDVVWSKEKPVTVKVSGNNVFVKFLVAHEGTSESHITSPLDVHVVCGGEVFTLILHPQDVDSVTVHLSDPVKKDLEAVAKDWGSLAWEDKVKKLTVVAYRHEVPVGFSRAPIASGDPRSNIHAYQDLEITGESDLIAPGTGLRATEYTVRAVKAMTLSERDFLLPAMGEIAAVTVDPLYVAAQGASRVIVITRSPRDEH